MTLKCEVCGNTQSFMASAQTTIDVRINGNKEVIDARPGQQLLDNIIVIKPWKCTVCGTANKIIEREEENAGTGEISPT